MKQGEAYYLLDEAIKAVAHNADVQIEPLQREVREGNRMVDAFIRLRVREATKELRVEIKANVNNTTIAHLANTLGAERDGWLLVTTYVTPQAAQKLRALQIQFIDVAGNAFINLPEAYVFIQGKRLPSFWGYQPDYEHQWTQAGVKVVFAILREPNLVTVPYRMLAARARVALGTVAGIMKMLTVRGFIHETVGHKQIRNRKQLLDTWTVAYAEKLRHKTLLGTFNTRDELTDLGRRATAFGAQLGGEFAAARLTQYLKPELLTIYADTNLTQLLVALKLIRDPNGKCEVRRKFWLDKPGERPELVPTVLVYADLLATAEARNAETAKHLYEVHVREHLETD
jgi:hypothetical protein